MTTKRVPIKSVSVIGTGTGEGHPEHLYGTRKPTLWWILTSQRWVPLPINVYVVEHHDGLVLFDAGMDQAVATDPNYWPDRITRFFMGRIFRFQIGPEDTLTRQLELAGYSVDNVSRAVISHLHFDHVGCIREIPQADLFVSDEAWLHMLGPHPEREGVLRRDIDIPAKWHRITFSPTDDPSLAPFTHAYDLMGDGSMMLLPTPGHLPGSFSMLVSRNGGAAPLLFVGDLCYSLDSLMRDRLPGTGDKKQLRESYAKVRALKERIPDLMIIPSHDPDAAALLRSAAPGTLRTTEL